MVCGAQSHRVCGLFALSGILDGWRLDLCLSVGECWDTPTLFCPLERANLNHWTTQVGVSFPSPECGGRSGFQSVAFSSCLELRTVDTGHSL
jgi:hypothetical protein